MRTVFYTVISVSVLGMQLIYKTIPFLLTFRSELKELCHHSNEQMYLQFTLFQNNKFLRSYVTLIGHLS
jgi:hypothetical protein